MIVNQSSSLSYLKDAPWSIHVPLLWQLLSLHSPWIQWFTLRPCDTTPGDLQLPWLPTRKRNSYRQPVVNLMERNRPIKNFTWMQWHFWKVKIYLCFTENYVGFTMIDLSKIKYSKKFSAVLCIFDIIILCWQISAGKCSPMRGGMNSFMNFFLWILSKV